MAAILLKVLTFSTSLTTNVKRYENEIIALSIGPLLFVFSMIL